MSGYCEDCGNTLCVCSEITASQWQPIETVPKDGTEVLFYNKGCIEHVIYSEQYDQWYCKTDGSIINKPKHWMPLPEPPKGEL